jgi:Zn-finger protein
MNIGKQFCINYTKATENASHSLTLSAYLEKLHFTLQHISLCLSPFWPCGSYDYDDQIINFSYKWFELLNTSWIGMTGDKISGKEGEA